MPETKHGIPHFDPMPLPTHEHQRRITKQKWFEIVTVVILILAGVGFLIWRDVRAHNHVDPSRSLAESAKTIELAGGTSVGDAVIRNRHFLSFQQKLDAFTCHIDLVGINADAPLETAVLSLTPTPGMSPQSPESLQSAVNAVGVLGQKLVLSSSDALEKASRTMVYLSESRRPHDKGVAGSSDGWKVTYATYRSFDDNAEPEPVLYLIVQRLTAGSDLELADFNRILYDAVNQGRDVKSHLQAAL